jgi:hypothetical protein
MMHHTRAFRGSCPEVFDIPVGGVVLVGEARDVARQWVVEQGSRTPGFAGAFFHGSINWLADDNVLPATSDVDVMLVIDDPRPAAKPGKCVYQDVLLEVSLLPSDRLRSPEDVLGTYNLAGSFHVPSVILDPTGGLTALQAAVATGYAERRWVRRRCLDARDKILHGYAWNSGDLWPDQVVSWLFPAGITTHVLLVAGLKNPTVRRRYLAARALLTEYGQLDLYEELLALLGCATMTSQRAAQHLTALAEAFDAAAAVITSPFFFAADISPIGRTVAIAGSQELIARGDHREAVFWMVATYSRCQTIFHHDAAHLESRFARGYHDLLADLGIETVADLERRIGEVREFVPRVWEAAEAIMAANPGISHQ